jgi:N6-adenosine-specific RNA methylase IME4
MALQGSLKARQESAYERFSDGLKARGVLADGESLRGQYEEESEPCKYCEKPVHPDNYIDHMKLYHEEEWDGSLPRALRTNGKHAAANVQTLTIDPEFQNLIPPQTDEERAALEASILAEGCREALVVWHNTLVDGHHRYAICQQHGIPFNVLEKEFDSRDDVIIWMVRNQFARRNISAFSRSSLALKMEEAIARKAKGNQLSGLKQGDAPVFQNSGKRETVHTDKEIAKLADVSHDTIHKVKKVNASAPKFVQDEARKGNLSVNRAYLLTKALENAAPDVLALVERTSLEEPEKVEILKRLHRSGFNPDSNGTFDEIARTGGFAYGDEMEQRCDFFEAGVTEVNRALKSLEEHHRRLAMDERRARAAQTLSPNGTYRCLVIDPPWPMEKIEREVRPKQGRYLDYPSMTLDSIQALPVASLAADDCHLYLWTTQKFLPDALRLAEAWGFRYQCLMTWVKPTGMTPYSWMYNTEHVIFARRGHLALNQNGLKLSFEAPSPGHSIKPDVFYERVQIASSGPRLEMFARRERDGFTAWGDEICNPA